MSDDAGVTAEATEPTVEPATPGTPETPEAPDRTWIRQSLVAGAIVVSILLGAAVATGVWLVRGLPGQPVQHFSVSVYLKDDVTAEQKAAIEAALPAFQPVGPITFIDRDKAWRHAKELFKDDPDFLDSVNPDVMPQSFSLETKGRLFDCTGYATVRHLPGVQKVQVVQAPVNHYIASITCDAEYR
ncbi:hypothetical protein ACWT_5060 [Actinoplanes sp. SE50]|uniref:permease-like cell division protein FtsX n=1 Tax=unclassified Actinoplanes TaxID=2626549 RepID=UPI00023ECF09|nr:MULTISPECIES: permease-like cell division protein FtsX [unclassified Actinoplanes]AEV86077.1 hypothetical protein ACPL_5190 [Actinoplanes sp. SE50/110]ATO84475.1 hypothetical protein ACWT_5060 [Actinoplanes sp. SE50]SLM01885.1 hypothetical protein ACSP50_5123 [Actinoplanes sp. SE50/110]